MSKEQYKLQLAGKEIAYDKFTQIQALEDMGFRMEPQGRLEGRFERTCRLS
jgi:hypothetical protein